MRQWPNGYDSNGMDQEVVLELPGCYKDCIEQLLNLRVPCLKVLQDLTEKVHKLLFDFCLGLMTFNDDDCTNYCVGSCNV
jgi:hypothetical protein